MLSGLILLVLGVSAVVENTGMTGISNIISPASVPGIIMSLSKLLLSALLSFPGIVTVSLPKLLFIPVPEVFGTKPLFAGFGGSGCGLPAKVSSLFKVASSTNRGNSSFVESLIAAPFTLVAKVKTEKYKNIRCSNHCFRTVASESKLFDPTLTQSCLAFHKMDIGKQYRSRSDAAYRGV